MRKFTIKKKTEPQNRLNSEPISNQPFNSFVSYKHGNRSDTLECFHDSLMHKNKLLSNIRNQSISVKSQKAAEIAKQQNHFKSIKRVANDMRQIRDQIERKNVEQEEIRDHKMSRFIDNLKEHVHQTSQPPLQLPPVQPIYYPFPPLNYSMAPGDFMHRQQRGHRRYRNNQRDEDSFYQTRRIKPKVNKAERTRRNIKRWRKVSNAILFTIYLKRYCNIMRNQRQLVFSNLKRSLKKNLQTIKEDIYKLLKPFFTVIVNKRQVSLQLEEDDDKQIRTEKVTSIRKLIAMVLQAIKKWTVFAKQNKKFTQIIYHLCRHGNFSCTEPILTEEQLDITCISTKFGYVSAESNLEKASYINLLFIKMVVFNILLASSKFTSELSGATIEENLQIITSLLYELVIDVQDDVMLKVPKSYTIGDYSEKRGIQKAKPLVYRNSPLQSGQLISGLKGEEWAKKNFKFQSWNQEKSLIDQTLSIFHGMMKQHHQKLANKVLESKSFSSLS